MLDVSKVLLRSAFHQTIFNGDYLWSVVLALVFLHCNNDTEALGACSNMSIYVTEENNQASEPDLFYVYVILFFVSKTNKWCICICGIILL